MAKNIIEIVREKAGYPVVEKIDPNLQEPDGKAMQNTTDKLAQAAIPAVLSGLFRFTRTDKGCNYILVGGGNQSWLEAIYEDKKNEAVEKIAHYAGTSTAEAEKKMEDIAVIAVVIIHEQTGEKVTAEKLKSYMSGQRHNILVHLPAELQMGYLMDDNSLDDRTNKMEGPISNLMHNIENKFSGGGS